MELVKQQEVQLQICHTARLYSVQHIRFWAFQFLSCNFSPSQGANAEFIETSKIVIIDPQVYARLYSALSAAPHIFVIIILSSIFNTVRDSMWGMNGKLIGNAYFQ